MIVNFIKILDLWRMLHKPQLNSSLGLSAREIYHIGSIYPPQISKTVNLNTIEDLTITFLQIFQNEFVSLYFEGR